MAYYIQYAVPEEQSSVPLVCVNSCFEIDDILRMELSTTDGVPSLTIQVDSCIKGVPGAEWVLIDVKPDFIESIENNGLIIYDLDTSANFIFSGIEAGTVVESSINTNRVVLPAAIA